MINVIVDALAGKSSQKQINDLAQYQLPPTKEHLLQSITVTTSSGKTFDGDELSQTRMARALQIGAFTGQTSTAWKLADDTVEQVTYVELQEALTLAMIEVGKIVGAI